MNLTSEFRNSRFYNVPKTVVDLGPFIGGLNSELRPDLISEHECQKLVNYSIRADGSLISRPSATYQIAPMAAVAGTSYYPVGQLTLSTGTKLYPLIAKVAGANTTFYYFDPTLGWLQAWASLAVTATR